MPAPTTAQPGPQPAAQPRAHVEPPLKAVQGAELLPPPAPDTAAPRPASQVPHPAVIRLIGTGAALVGIALVVLIAVLWRVPEQCKPDCSLWFPRIGMQHWSYDRLLVALVFVAGSLGSYVHAATSFADYVGNRRIMRSWTWWYLLRLPIGGVLALLLYFVFRAGFVAGGDVSPFGIVAMSGLAGLFSRHTLDKLAGVFDSTLGANQERNGKLRLTPGLRIDGLVPAVVDQAKPVPVTITGAGFVPGAAVRVGKSERKTRYDGATQLTVELDAADVTTKGVVYVTVINPGGQASGSSQLTVR